MSRYILLFFTEFKLFLKDKNNFILLFILFPLISFLIQISFPNKLEYRMFFLIILSLFVGVNGTIREVVANFKVFLRLYSAGLKIFEFLLLKISIHFFIGFYIAIIAIFFHVFLIIDDDILNNKLNQIFYSKKDMINWVEYSKLNYEELELKFEEIYNESYDVDEDFIETEEQKEKLDRFKTLEKQRNLGEIINQNNLPENKFMLYNISRNSKFRDKTNVFIKLNKLKFEFIAIYLIYIIGVFSGICISCIYNKETAAIRIIPFIIVPQMILSKLVLNDSKDPRILRVFGPINNFFGNQYKYYVLPKVLSIFTFSRYITEISEIDYKNNVFSLLKNYDFSIIIFFIIILFFSSYSFINYKISKLKNGQLEREF